MRIVAISDTHSYHRQVDVPPGDVFVCCGDITFKGELKIVEDFCAWMKILPHRHKICIFGNHEVGFEHGSKREPAIKMIKDAGAHYLEDSGIEIEGLKCYGSPITKRFFDWEFNRSPGAEILRHWDMIPENTELLFTHGQPYGINDLAPRGFGEFEHVGDTDLLARVKQLPKLKAYIGGHLHTPGGTQTTIDGVIYANAAICTEQYKPTNKPIVIDLP